jgi:hypothetical protein
MANLAITANMFINIAGPPNLGRDGRRSHIRRLVMTNYHRRRRRIENQSRKEDCRSQNSRDRPSSNTVHQSSAPPSAGNGNLPHTIILPLAIPSLLQPKIHVDPTQTRISEIIRGFLRGIVVRSVRSFDTVGFIHHATSELDEETADPLTTCQTILNYHYNSPPSCRSTSWERILAAQENIYRTVRFVPRSQK